MEEIVLKAEKRQLVGKKVRHLRQAGYVPGVLYGHNIDPISLKIEGRVLDPVLQVAGTNRLITLTIDGVREPKRVLVRDLQRDVITHAMLHIDLYEVIMTERITAEVPVVLRGESAVVRAGEGLLFEGLDSIEIECLPGDLPPQIEVDISGLAAIDDTILIRDLKVSEAIEILADAEEVVVKILPPEREEIEEEVVVEEEAPEVEVVGREKELEAEAEKKTDSAEE
jgi:large subunit ribosomal protein L25